MDFNQVLTQAHLDYICAEAMCKEEEIEVWAIPDTLAISYWFTTVLQATQYYKEFAEENGKRINNIFSWDEFEGFNNRLIIFPKGHAVCDTPFHPKEKKSEIDAIREVLKGSNYEVVEF